LSLFFVAVLAALACVACSIERVRKVLAVAPAVEIELAEALREAEATGLDRDVAIDQVAFEADFALSRWKPVPRMAARISSSCGFLLAAAQLREILANLGDQPLTEAGEPLVIGALQIVAAALAGTSLCLALGREAERARRLEAEHIDSRLRAA